jgi:hypothetical protein
MDASSRRTMLATTPAGALLTAIWIPRTAASNGD